MSRAGIADDGFLSPPSAVALLRGRRTAGQSTSKVGLVVGFARSSSVVSDPRKISFMVFCCLLIVVSWFVSVFVVVLNYCVLFLSDLNCFKLFLNCFVCLSNGF